MLGYLESAGYRIVGNAAQADIVLVNTCAFIQEAKQEAIDTILEMASLRTPDRQSSLIVCGCFSQRYREEVASQFPEVDYWVGVHDWEKDFRTLFPGAPSPAAQRRLTLPGGTEYLKIAQGCSHRCSFCVIPSIRGPFRSRPYEDILREANWLADQGVNECILVSQDTTGYGRDLGHDLTWLLERLLKDTPFPWIRLMYLSPSRVDDTLLDLVASEERMCSYFDIPLQHIADPVLKAMRRAPDSKGTRKLIERIRSRVPGAAIRTTFIVGFPGETRNHFRQLLRFVEDTRFERLGVFPFSPEEGTPAYTMRPRPRNATALRRCEAIMGVQREISRELGESHIGRTVDVMVDGIAENSSYNFEARTQWDAPEVDGKVMIAEGDAVPGRPARVRIVDADAYDLYAVRTD